MEIQKSRHATHLLHTHIVFVAKYRYHILESKHIDYLKNIFAESMEEFNCESNHVHLLIQYPPKQSISHIVNNLKGKSSRLLRRDMPEVKKRYWGNGSALWHRSYFAGSVGGAPLEIVKQYIQQQDTPH